ncbi:hypothetical protein BaRGS_00001946 [Batillaria attramentaria]|uniref:Uncharacterized protein n=1 Tax=Batillaria attramentaria TaxID=370345 RepID=A0ABD0M578_9CAEN
MKLIDWGLTLTTFTTPLKGIPRVDLLFSRDTLCQPPCRPPCSQQPDRTHSPSQHIAVTLNPVNNIAIFVPVARGVFRLTRARTSGPTVDQICLWFQPLPFPVREPPTRSLLKDWKQKRNQNVIRSRSITKHRYEKRLGKVYRTLVSMFYNHDPFEQRKVTTEGTRNVPLSLNNSRTVFML